MANAWKIAKKEFRGYFHSPIAPIVIAVFLLVTGWFFFSTFFLYNQASLRGYFQLLPLTLSFIVPAVTMRLFAEEYHLGSYEILMTFPVTPWEVILGKFVAAVGFCAVMIAPTLAYAVTVAFLGRLDAGPVVGGFLGAILLAALFSAIGLFSSSLTRNQIIAFIIGMALCFFLTLIDKLLFFLPEALLPFCQSLGADHHFQNIGKGVIDSRDLLYFVSLTFLALAGTRLVMEEKK